MTRIRRLRTQQGFIYTPAVINAAMDKSADDVAHAVTADAFETYVNDQPWYVLAGFNVYSEGDNDIALSPGVAISRLGAVPRMVSIHEGMEAYASSLAAPDASEPRIDLVCLVITDGDRASSSQAQVAGVPATVATQSGGTIVLTIVNGVPDAAPVAPSLPAGALLLAHCLTEVDGTVTILDRRPWAPRGLQYRGPVFAAHKFVIDLPYADTRAQLIDVLARPGSLDATGPGQVTYTSSVHWDVPNDIPIIVREKGAAGETTGDHGLMLIPGGRQYQITRDFPSRSPPQFWFNEASGTPGLGIDKTDFACERLLIQAPNDGGDIMIFTFPIGIDLRSLKLDGGGIIFDANMSGPAVTMTVKIQHRAKFATTWTDVASKVFTPVGIVSPAEYALDVVAATIATGMARIYIKIEKSGSGTMGISLRGVALTVTEGKA